MERVRKMRTAKKRRLNPEENKKSSRNNDAQVERDTHGAQSRFLDLPILVHCEIIKELDLEGKKAVRLTCTYLANRVMDFIKINPVLNDHSADAIFRTPYSFTSLKVTDLRRSRPECHQRPIFASNVSTLKIEEDALSGLPATSTNILWTLRIFNNLTHLYVTGAALYYLSPSDCSNIKLDNLIHLNLTFTGHRRRNRTMESLSGATFPRLATFELIVANLPQGRLQFMESAWLARIILRHWESLKSLNIFDKGFGPIRYIIPDEGPDDAELMRMLSRVQLESMELRNNFIHDEVWSPTTRFFVKKLIGVQRCLKKLEIEIELHDEILPSLKLALRQSSNSLESLKVICNPNRQVRFNCEWIQGINLKRFDISSSMSVANLHHLPESIVRLVWNAPISTFEATVLHFFHRNLNSLTVGALAGELTENVGLKLLTLRGLKRFVLITSSHRILTLIVRIHMSVRTTNTGRVGLTLRERYYTFHRDLPPLPT